MRNLRCATLLLLCVPCLGSKPSEVSDMSTLIETILRLTWEPDCRNPGPKYCPPVQDLEGNLWATQNRSDELPGVLDAVLLTLVTDDYTYAASFDRLQIHLPSGALHREYSVHDQFENEAQALRIGSFTFLPEHFGGVIYLNVVGESLDGRDYFFRGVLLKKDGTELGPVFDPDLPDPRALYFRNLFFLSDGRVLGNIWLRSPVSNYQVMALREVEIVEVLHSVYTPGWGSAFKVKLGATLLSQSRDNQSSRGVTVQEEEDGKIRVVFLDLDKPGCSVGRCTARD